jgi:hypothetical protein
MAKQNGDFFCALTRKNSQGPFAARALIRLRPMFLSLCNTCNSERLICGNVGQEMPDCLVNRSTFRNFGFTEVTMSRE